MILVPVAGGAWQRRILEPQRAMAFLARHHSVASDQWKSRDVVIEGRNAAPIVLAMASLALNAKLAFVPIILAVARHTYCRQLVAIEIASMARISLDHRMCGLERKFRLFVVIEANRDPLVLVMTAFALGSIPSGVDVLNLVAITACCANPLVAFPNVTRGARYIAMRTLQRERGLVVVESLHAMPCGFAMTIVALLP